MTLFDALNDNTLLLGNDIHPSYDLQHISTDLNYFVHSPDEYLNHLVTTEIIERLSNITRKDLIGKECDSMPFFSQQNVLCLDVSVISKKSRQDIESFIRRIVKRKPLVGDKHIISIINFHEICTKYQMHFKTLIESNCANACFILTSTKVQAGASSIYSLCMPLRTPILSKNESKNLLKRVLKIHNGTCELGAKIDHDLPLYAQITNLNSNIHGGNSYVDVFKNEISGLVDFLKNSKRKSLEKIILHIRVTVNKVLYYSIPDHVICQYIAKKILSLKKINKSESILKICDAEKHLIDSTKKIFVYELLFLDLYELLMKAYP